MGQILGATPVNQYNALPINTVDVQAAAGDIQVVGGTISKFWSPAILGINGVNASTVAGSVLLASAYIDATGCSRYTGLLRRTNAVGDAANRAAFFVYVQYRLTKVATPAAAIAGDQQTRIGKINCISTGLVFETNGAGTAIDETAAFTWSSEAPTGSSGNARPLVIGTDCRIIIDWSTAANPPGANDFFQFQLWGQT
jgi:hypothetical protein